MDFRESFEGYVRVFLAVVHVENEEQAERNVEIARHNGAHGVFLINHSIDPFTLLGIYQKVRMRHRGWWIGLNLLNMSPLVAFAAVPSDVSGLWFDRGGVDLTAANPVREAREIVRAHDRSDWRGVHFGGVAFKYQPKTGEPSEEARLAKPYMDVITTSGERTGEPPSLDKIIAMRGAICDKPLAVASGITLENAGAYLRHVDCVLVATGVSFNHTELDPDRVRVLSDIIRAW